MSNGFLKSNETLTIIPASEKTKRGSSVHWYEVQVVPRERLGRVISCDKQGEIVGVAEAMLVDDLRQGLRSLKVGSLYLPLKLALSGSDEINLNTRIGEAEASLTGKIGDPTSLRRSDNAISPSQKLPTHWLSLYDPLIMLAEALKVRATDGRSWGCTSCLIFLAGDAIAAGGCVAEPSPGVCAAALTGWGVFTANCEGACA